MRVGTENRTQLWAAIGLGVVALVLMTTRFIGSFAPSSSSAATPALSTATTAPMPAPAHLGGKTRSASNNPNATRSLDPTLRLALLKLSEDTKYAGTGRNIFRIFVEPPPRPIVPPVRQSQPNPGPPPPPPPPPINLAFYGFATPAGGSKRIFLAQGEDVFIATEGDIVNRRYKIVHIGPNAVEILDVLSNNRQSIPLTQ
ncbi:MAG: hypothetical protein JO356_07490 [Acidobacteria bacterium]|nr:hypothetical protein [Acidobacteriota bacterium]